MSPLIPGPLLVTAALHSVLIGLNCVVLARKEEKKEEMRHQSNPRVSHLYKYLFTATYSSIKEKKNPVRIWGKKALNLKDIFIKELRIWGKAV